MIDGRDMEANMKKIFFFYIPEVFKMFDTLDSHGYSLPREPIPKIQKAVTYVCV